MLPSSQMVYFLCPVQSTDQGFGLAAALENIKLKEEILRLKKWQILAIQNSRENKVLKKLLNATDNN